MAYFIKKMATKEDATKEPLIAAEEKRFMVQVERCLLDIQETEKNLADFLRQRKELETQMQDEGSPARRAQLSFAQSQLFDEVESSKMILADLRVQLQEAQKGIEAIQQRKELLPPFLAKINTYNRCLTELFIATDELVEAALEARKNSVDVRIHGLLGTAAGYLNSRADLLPRTVTRLEVNKSAQIRAAFIATGDFVAASQQSK